MDFHGECWSFFIIMCVLCSVPQHMARRFEETVLETSYRKDCRNCLVRRLTSSCWRAWTYLTSTTFHTRSSSRGREKFLSTSRVSLNKFIYTHLFHFIQFFKFFLFYQLFYQLLLMLSFFFCFTHLNVHLIHSLFNYHYFFLIYRGPEPLAADPSRPGR